MYFIFVNFKTYPQGSGEEAIQLAKKLEEASNQTTVQVIPVVQAADVKEVAEFVKLDVWVQNIDPVEYGAHTGAVLPEATVEDGAKGTFLNHSEHKFTNFEDLKKATERAKAVGLKTLIFAADLDELRLILRLNPDYVSYEPPELVGSTTVSVSSAHSDVIAKAYELTKPYNIPLIVGAGVHSREDVAVGVKLGAVGIAVATNIVKAEDPKKELMELIEGFK
jgi:triosephosphate isomerase